MKNKAQGDGGERLFQNLKEWGDFKEAQRDSYVYSASQQPHLHFSLQHRMAPSLHTSPLRFQCTSLTPYSNSHVSRNIEGT